MFEQNTVGLDMQIYKYLYMSIMPIYITITKSQI